MTVTDSERQARSRNRTNTMNMTNLPVRACSIQNRQHPEWGTFGIMEDCGMYYEIFGDAGHRILSKCEAVQSWEVAGAVS